MRPAKQGRTMRRSKFKLEFLFCKIIAGQKYLSYSGCQNSLEHLGHSFVIRIANHSDQVLIPPRLRKNVDLEALEGYCNRGANHSQKRCTRLLITRDYFVIKVIIFWLMGLFCDYFVINVWFFCDCFVIFLWLFDYFAIIWLFWDYRMIILWLFWKVYEINNQWFAPRLQPF